jgi:hypothetical protein
MSGTLESLAVAGAWGYIGRKFVDAGLALGLDVAVLDPGPPPDDLDRARLRMPDADTFYDEPADLFHLALHPEHRAEALAHLLARARTEGIAILNEKPMAAPERPEECEQLLAALDGTQAAMLFDFPELFEPLTARVVEELRARGDVQLDEIVVRRSKDREDPANPRNRKRMVSIEYQESVHDLAWLLHVLGHLHGGAGELLDRGVAVTAAARPYTPPNPEDYTHLVSGRVDYRLRLGGVEIDGRTDFTRGAPWTKSRTLRGSAGGRSFVIEVEYLEGAKRLVVDGVDRGVAAEASSYEAVLQTLGAWRAEDPTLAGNDLRPTPAFTRLTYQLSSLLWRSAHDESALGVANTRGLLEFDAGYAEAVRDVPRYA